MVVYKLDLEWTPREIERFDAPRDRRPEGWRCEEGILATGRELNLERFRRWYDTTLRINRSIFLKAKRRNRALERYKPTDLPLLAVSILQGLDSSKEMDVVHEVMWNQPLPNGNHRSSTAAWLELNDVRVTAAQVLNSSNRWFPALKELLFDAAQGRQAPDAKPTHRRLVQAMLQELLVHAR